MYMSGLFAQNCTLNGMTFNGIAFINNYTVDLGGVYIGVKRN